MRNSWNLITSAFDCFFSFFNSCSLGTNIGSKEFLYWHTTSLDIRWQARQRNNHSLLRCLQIGLAKDFTWWNNWQYQPNINPPTHPVCLKQKLIINHHERIQNITSQKCVLIFFQLAGIQLSKKNNINQATVSFAFITSGTEGIFTGLGGFTGTTGFSGDSLGFLGLSLEVSMVVSCITNKCHDLRVTKK